MKSHNLEINKFNANNSYCTSLFTITMYFHTAKDNNNLVRYSTCMQHAAILLFVKLLVYLGTNKSDSYNNQFEQQY